MELNSISPSTVINNQHQVFDPRITDKDQAQRLWTSESVELAKKGLADGYKLIESPYNSRITGDVKLKRANLPFKYTPEEFMEKKRSMHDKVYFGNNHVSLKDPVYGWQRVTLRDYQCNLLKRYTKNRWNIILFPRQSGKTTTTIIEIVHFLTFNIDKDCVVVAQSAIVVEEILQKIKYAFSSMPFYMQPGFVSFTNDKIVLDNGCRLSIGVASESVVQGFSLDFLYIDEFAYIKESMVHKFWINIYPSLQANPHSRCVITSTPNGRNLFHTMWTGAINGTNTFVPYRIYVTDVPRSQPFEEFKKETIKNVGIDGWLMGYECSFDVGLKSVFHTTTQLKLRDWQRMGEDIIDDNGNKISQVWSNDNNFLGSLHKDLSFIKQGTEAVIADEKHTITYNLNKDKFVMTVDISEGLDQDYTVLKIYKMMWSRKHKRIVYVCIAVLRTNDTSVEDFARLVADMLRHINQSNIRIVVESNNYGGEFFSTLKFLSNYDKKYNYIQMEVFAKTMRKSISKLEYGIRLTEESKAVGIKRFTNMIRNDQMWTSHNESIEEYLNFGRQRNGTFKANYGHDDLVMADVDLAYWINADDSNSNQYIKDVESFLRSLENDSDSVVKIYDSEDTSVQIISFNNSSFNIRNHEAAINKKPKQELDNNYFDDQYNLGNNTMSTVVM